MISVVCVYNNKKILEEFLVNSLKEQSGEYHLILVDNTQGRFSSAAQALNYGATQVNTDYIMFAHQDIELSSATWLTEAENLIESLGALGVAGVAGMSETGRDNRERGRNIITHLENRRAWEWGNPITKPEIVQTVDGCLFITPKEVYGSIKFDEKVCDDWHLYEVDYCLNCKESGHEVYAIPLPVYHASMGPWHLPSKIKIFISLGPLPKTYYASLAKVVSKHRKNFSHIYTTCGDWSTSTPIIYQRIFNVAIGGLSLIMKRMGWLRQSRKCN